MKCSEIISEMPMNSIRFHGNMDREGTFRPDDVKKFNNPKWNERVLSIFKNSPYDINLHILNGKEDKSIDFKTDHFISNLKRKDVKGVHVAAWVDKIIGYRPKDYENALNVLMIFNEGDDRVGLTPWIVAHRIGHIFLDDDTKKSIHALNIQDAFENFIRIMTRSLDLYHLDHSTISKSELMDEIAYRTMTFKSARNRNLSRAGEALIEMFAQFLIKGELVLKKIPNKRPSVNDDISTISSAIVNGDMAGLPDEKIAIYIDRYDNSLSYSEVLNALRNHAGDISDAIKYYKNIRTNNTIESFQYKLNDLFDKLIKDGIGKFLVI